jgi:hypothetical protein
VDANHWEVRSDFPSDFRRVRLHGETPSVYSVYKAHERKSTPQAVKDRGRASGSRRSGLLE